MRLYDKIIDTFGNQADITEDSIIYEDKTHCQVEVVCHDGKERVFVADVVDGTTVFSTRERLI